MLPGVHHITFLPPQLFPFWMQPLFAFKHHLNASASFTLGSMIGIRHPPRDFPYTRAQSAYSAMIQLYSRSRQLDSALNLHSRLHHPQPWCRFGCPVLESTHHVYANCPYFVGLRKTAALNLHNRVQTVLQSFRTELVDHPDLQHYCSTIFSDGAIWPGGQAVFYRGLIPEISGLLHPPSISHLSTLQISRLITRLANETHTSAIHLAGRIWGELHTAYHIDTNTPPFKGHPSAAHIVSDSGFNVISYYS